MDLVCKKGYEIGCVYEKDCGYYMGTIPRRGVPKCRLTAYAPTEYLAKRYPYVRMFYHREMEYCNEGRGCFD